eukprot:1924263-Pleurochrysis_carterae.AAC.1
MQSKVTGRLGAIRFLHGSQAFWVFHVIPISSTLLDREHLCPLAFARWGETSLWHAAGWYNRHIAHWARWQTGGCSSLRDEFQTSTDRLTADTCFELSK